MYVCLYVGAQAFGCMCVRAYGGQRAPLGVVPQGLPTLPVETWCLTDPRLTH